MVQQLVLLGQVLVVVLLYLLVWRIIRTARRDLLDSPGRGVSSGSAAHALGSPDQSTIIPASAVRAARANMGGQDVRMIVESSSLLSPGVPFSVAEGLTIGRAPGNDIVLAEPMVSGKHARVLAPSTLEDLGSTNGTLVNGKAVVGRIRLSPGDRITIGSTTLRVEVSAR